MCGVAAIYAYHYAALEVDREELRGIRDRMVRRGPDGCGEWFSTDQKIGLGHRRLSILDLSEKGAQPMSSADGTVVISFNGEIYNYQEIRKQLESEGYVFRSGTDTEVLIYLYQSKGEAMLRALRGMFALVIWDERQKKMFVARDPYGIKPLYYADDGWTVRIASSVKALLSSPKVSRLKEPAGIVSFFLLGSVLEPFTTYQEIRALPAGSFMWIDSIGPSIPVQYFSISSVFKEAQEKSGKINPREIPDRMREALLESVRYHFVSDVPVGIFLSSGVDSSCLLGLARQEGIKDIQTITLAFNEFKNTLDDESVLAEKVAGLYGSKHSTVWISRDQFKKEMSLFFDTMDQPSIDGMNTYLVSKIAREKGLKVALSGLGGDELFGGYPSFRDIPRWVSFMRPFHFLPGAGAAARYALQLAAPKSISPKFAGIAEYGGSYAGAYLLKRGLFMPWELEKILGKETAREGWKRLGLFKRLGRALTPDPRNDFFKVASLESSVYMRNQLLRDADWAGMAHSLEIRVPFVDAALLKKIAPLMISSAQKLSKRLLTESLSNPLPDNISARKKSGFQVPVGEWLSADQELRRCEDNARLAQSSAHWSRRWAYEVSEQLTEKI